MTINEQADITGQTAKTLRKSLGMQQKDFWGAVCVSGASGSNYETLRTPEIPEPVKRLIFLHYVCGVPTDQSPQTLKQLAPADRPSPGALSQLEAHLRQAEACLAQARAAIRQ